MTVASDIVAAIEADIARGPFGPRGDWQRGYALLVKALADGAPRAFEAFAGGVAPSTDADPYATWKALASAARDSSSPFRVSAAFAVHPYLTAGENWLFRVDHDAEHVRTGQPAFDVLGEVGLYFDTWRRFARYGAGLPYFAENVGQVLYFAKHGRFPTFADGTQWAPMGDTARWNELRERFHTEEG